MADQNMALLVNDAIRSGANPKDVVEAKQFLGEFSETDSSSFIQAYNDESGARAVGSEKDESIYRDALEGTVRNVNPDEIIEAKQFLGEWDEQDVQKYKDLLLASKEDAPDVDTARIIGEMRKGGAIGDNLSSTAGLDLDTIRRVKAAFTDEDSAIKVPSDTTLELTLPGGKEVSVPPRHMWDKMGEVGALESFKNLRAIEKIPFFSLGWKIGELVTMRNSANRIEEAQADGKDIFSEEYADDLDSLHDTWIAEEYRKARGQTWGGIAVDMVSELPGFLIEMWASGGIAGVAKGAAKKSLAKLGTSAAARAARGVAGLAARATARVATVGVPRVAKGYLERTNPQAVFGGAYEVRIEQSKETPVSALYKAVGDTFIEYLSEESGEIIGKLGGAAIGKLMGRSAKFAKLVNATKKSWMKVAGKGTGAWAKKLNDIGYHGVLEEMGDERLGDVLRSVTGVSDQTVGEALIPTYKQFMAELVTFGTMGGGFTVGGIAVNKWADKNPEQAKKLSQIEKPSRKDMQEAGITEKMSAPERAEFVASIPKVKKAAPEAKKEFDPEKTSDEIELHTRTDAKGRKVTYFKNEKEGSDGYKTTTYTFNRDDKASNQRNSSVLSLNETVFAEFEDEIFENDFFKDSEGVWSKDNTDVSVKKVRTSPDGTKIVFDIKVDNTEGDTLSVDGIIVERKFDPEKTIPMVGQLLRPEKKAATTEGTPESDMALAKKVASKLKIPGSDIEELASIAVTHLVEQKKKGKFNVDETKGNYESLAYKVMRNKLLTLAEKQKEPVGTIDREEEASLKDSIPAKENESLIAEEDKEDFNEIMNEAIDALPKRQSAIVRGFIEGKSDTQIAEEIGVTKQDVNEQRKVAFETLKKKVGAKGLKLATAKSVDLVGDLPAIYENPSDGSVKLYSGLGDLNFSKKVGLGAVHSFLKTNFISDLPKVVATRKIKRDGEITSALTQTKLVVSDFKKAAKEVYGTKNIPLETAIDLNKALQDDTLRAKLDPRMSEAILKMRTEIDSLSKELMDSGAIQGDLATIVTDNLGVYLHRSYRAFDTQGWPAKVPDDVKNKAISFIRGELAESEPGLTAVEAEERVHGMIDRLLNPKEDSPLSFMANLSGGGKDLSIIKRRKTIPPEIRALWGERQTPIENYVTSVGKMSALLANHKYLSDVRELGMGKFFFENAINREGVSYRTKIAGDESKPYHPLNGLFTTPEIAKAFHDSDSAGDLPTWFKHYMKVNGIVKFSKTIGSVQTHIRNVLGNTGFAVANGHWQVWKSWKASSTMVNVIKNNDKEGAIQYFRELQELGVIHESVRAGEFMDVMNDAIKHNDISEFTDTYSKNLAKRVSGWFVTAYRAEDDVWKIYAFENELARYSKAKPEWSEQKVKEYCAGIVRDTYPTYSLVPKGIKTLRRFPIVGTFVSFPAEVFRTAKNSILLTKKELSDPDTRKIGAQRLAGLSMAAVASSAIATASRYLLGISDDEDEDVRRFVAPWNKNSNLVYIANMINGVSSFIDLSYMDPHQYLKKPLVALLSGGDIEESAIEATREALEPFIGEEILLGKVLDIARNKKKMGGKIYNESDSYIEKSLKKAKHVAEAMEPGTITSMRRVWRGLSGYTSPYGRTYDPTEEALATFSGTRVVKLDVKQALSFKGSQFARSFSDASSRIRGVINRQGTVKDDEIVSAYNTSEKNRKKLVSDLNKDMLAANRLGVDYGVVINQLDDAGVSKYLLKDGYRPYVPSGVDDYTKLDKVLPVGWWYVGESNDRLDKLAKSDTKKIHRLKRKDPDRNKKLAILKKRLMENPNFKKVKWLRSLR